jgi:hypothetical protein
MACASSAGRVPPGSAAGTTGNAAPPGAGFLPARPGEVHPALTIDVPAADPFPLTSFAFAERRCPLLVLSVSLVLLLGVLVWFLVRFASLRGWHALFCVLFGFYLACTPLGPYIQTGCRAVARIVAGVGS